MVSADERKTASLHSVEMSSQRGNSRNRMVDAPDQPTLRQSKKSFKNQTIQTKNLEWRKKMEQVMLRILKLAGQGNGYIQD